VEGEPLDLDRYERWVKEVHEAAAHGLTSLSRIEEHALALVAALRAERAKKCAAPGVAMCAKEWQADHQALQLAHYGLDAEFAHDGCDAIGSVAAALVVARRERDEARAEVERLWSGFDLLRAFCTGMRSTPTGEALANAIETCFPEESSCPPR
jgi:hypothetical protein